jgi:hypothetical protein
LRNLEHHVHNTPTKGIRNVDEVGSPEWADRKKRSAVTAQQVLPGQVEYAVSCKENRISYIIFISMAGDVLMPLLVIHRRTIDDDGWEER